MKCRIVCVCGGVNLQTASMFVFGWEDGCWCPAPCRDDKSNEDEELEDEDEDEDEDEEKAVLERAWRDDKADVIDGGGGDGLEAVLDGDLAEGVVEVRFLAVLEGLSLHASCLMSSIRDFSASQIPESGSIPATNTCNKGSGRKSCR